LDIRNLNELRRAPGKGNAHILQAGGGASTVRLRRKRGMSVRTIMSRVVYSEKRIRWKVSSRQNTEDSDQSRGEGNFRGVENFPRGNLKRAGTPKKRVKLRGNWKNVYAF